MMTTTYAINAGCILFIVGVLALITVLLMIFHEHLIRERRQDTIEEVSEAMKDYMDYMMKRSIEELSNWQKKMMNQEEMKG